MSCLTVLSKWFYNNFMVPNPEKCSFMLLCINELQTDLVCGNETLKNNKQEKVLGVTNSKFNALTIALCEVCSNTEFFLVRIFPLFGLNTERYEVSVRIQS